jgi:hypothetical protein
MIKIEKVENGWIVTDFVGNQSVYTDPVVYIKRVIDVTMRNEDSNAIVVTRTQS